MGTELGYHDTLVRGATAAFEPGGIVEAHEINGPRFAHADLTTQELLSAVPISDSPNKEVFGA